MNITTNIKHIIQSLFNSFQNNKLHHGLLFCGNKSIGKSILANDLANQIILSSSKNREEDLKKIQSNSHPDLLVIKKDIKKRDIAIDAIRQINQFLNLSSAISDYRVIIIDAIDDLNKNSANAILKILEEPPANVFLFLINHNISKTLDTIKSRCDIIKINNPTDEEFAIALKENIPTINEEEIKILSKISDNSVGQAILMHNCQAIQIYQDIEKLAQNNNHKAIDNLSKRIIKEDIWEIFEKLIIFYLYNLTKSDDGFLNKEKIFFATDKINQLFSAIRGLNLDKTQSIINIFNIIQNAKN